MKIIETTGGCKATLLDALMTLNASIPATARMEDEFMVMRFTKTEWDAFCEASFNAIRVIKESRNNTR